MPVAIRIWSQWVVSHAALVAAVSCSRCETSLPLKMGLCAAAAAAAVLLVVMVNLRYAAAASRTSCFAAGTISRSRNAIRPRSARDRPPAARGSRSPVLNAA